MTADRDEVRAMTAERRGKPALEPREPTSGSGGSERGPGVIGRLCARGWEFSFFQAVWLLERFRSDCVPVGQRGPVAREAIRFRPDVSMGFPATDVRRVSEVKLPDGTSFYRVEPTFLGLYGVETPLPLHYAVQVLKSVESTRRRESASAPQALGDEPPLDPDSSPMRDFLDVLHHRLISLFYRAWTKYRYHVTYGLPGRDTITDYLLLLVGLMPTWTREQIGLSPTKLIRYAGLLTQRPRAAAALEGILTDFFQGLTTRITQCVGRWVSLGDDDLNRVGRANSRLGVDLTVGEQVYDLNGAFRMTFGPVDWEGFQLFLPDGPAFARARSLARLFCTDPLAFSIEVRLRAGQVPEMQLTSDSRGARLGYTSWVRTDDLPETSVVFEACK
ncbi:MAG: type VI secretion system baseplate subunit TssG [Phycisphaerae bacterium]|jgi:type VI secretion system protein ImpH